MTAPRRDAGRVGRRGRNVAERLHKTLTGARAPLLGVIANGVKARRLGSYDSTYGYAYAGAERPPIPWVSANGASASDETVPTAKALSPGRRRSTPPAGDGSL